MTLRLTVIRHAKSSWKGDEEDHARPLNKRGRHASDAVGDWLRDRMPEEVLCSDAVRARQTWGRIAAAADGPPARLVPELYHAEPEAILTVLRRAQAPHVALIGHNPGLGQFVSRIVAEPPEHPRFADYPTGATTIMTFEAGTWPEVEWQTGHVLDFVVPREL